MKAEELFDKYKTIDILSGLTVDGVITKENFIKAIAEITSVEPEISTGWTGEGELVKKEVSHNETVLYINYLDEQIVVLIPHDFDDFVKVGDDLEITIKVK